jgi:hypothetical protein
MKREPVHLDRSAMDTEQVPVHYGVIYHHQPSVSQMSYAGLKQSHTSANIVEDAELINKFQLESIIEVKPS